MAAAVEVAPAPTRRVVAVGAIQAGRPVMRRCGGCGRVFCVCPRRAASLASSSPLASVVSCRWCGAVGVAGHAWDCPSSRTTAAAAAAAGAEVPVGRAPAARLASREVRVPVPCPVARPVRVPVPQARWVPVRVPLLVVGGRALPAAVQPAVLGSLVLATALGSWVGRWVL